MDQIIYYTTEMLPSMLIALPVLLIVRIGINSVKKKQGYKTNMYHEFGVTVFTLFMVGLASQTLIPSWGFSFADPLGYISPLQYRVNLIPFQSLFYIVRSFLHGGYPDNQIIQFLGNIGMFAVPGFMLPVLWEKFESLKQTVRTCFFISLSIEIIQLFTSRSTDIEDILLNTLGGLLGFLSYSALKKVIAPDSLDKFKIKKGQVTRI